MGKKFLKENKGAFLEKKKGKPTMKKKKDLKKKKRTIRGIEKKRR